MGCVCDREKIESRNSVQNHSPNCHVYPASSSRQAQHPAGMADSSESPQAPLYACPLSEELFGVRKKLEVFAIAGPFQILFGNKTKGGGIDTEPQTRGGRSVREDMP